MKKFFLILLIPLLLAACNKNTSEEKITLNYWGVFEPEENLQEVIREYQSAHPNITINYSRRGLKDLKQQILARAGKENGPDIFRYHNSWLPEVGPILSVSPQSTLQAVDYEKTFYPVMVSDLKANRG